MIYFTSDLHFNHNREFLWKERGFSSLKEMNETIIENWNSIVNEDDIVYVLGDVVFGDLDEGKAYLERLHGSIKLVLGNHDGNTKIEMYRTLPNIEILGYSTIFQYKKHHFYLSHYPSITGNFDEEKPLRSKVINLCGHVHTKDCFYDWDKGIIFHVELDTHDFTPWTLEEILERVRERCELDKKL